MTESVHHVGGRQVRVWSVNTLVVGSGAAALNAAVVLHASQPDVIVVTDAWRGGTSANAGSDKQTYYRLAQSGETPDSARAMAEDLAAGGCMHGDIALAEAQHSAQAFYHLVALGVPFPHDTYGGFPGYRTDHDARGRGTSAGPLTSRLMVEALGREVLRRAVPVLDRHQVVALLVAEEGQARRVAGALAVDTRGGEGCAPPFVLFNARSVILATGGPAGMYADSVYPVGHEGSIGLALAAGATAQNLTESQFGLASIAFRWNLSGSYQQVLPRYVSTDPSGGDEREFLAEAFPDAVTLSGAVFRKGYQWPFDPRKVAGFGSSLIDLLVYREHVQRGRRVFLDYTTNAAARASAAPFSVDALDAEAREYLQRSGATGRTPIERLRQLNQPAVDLYLAHGIDLAAMRLEIAVSAQHNNGGLKGNAWWESDLEGLFPIGEVNGSHGVYRPGGAALNAGQVGGLRAAMFIARRRGGEPPDPAGFLSRVRDQVEAAFEFARASASAAPGVPAAADARAEIQARMSRAGALIRADAEVGRERDAAWRLRDRLRDAVAVAGAARVGEAFRVRDLALAHAMYLESIAAYIARGGRSRGSYLVVVAGEDGIDAAGGTPWRFSLTPQDAFVSSHILEAALDAEGRPCTRWEPVRPIPRPDTWFENVWRAFRSDEVIR